MSVPLENASPPKPPQKRWFANAYLFVFLGGLLDSTGELLLKKGAIVLEQVPATGILHFMATTFMSPPLGSGWSWLGIISYVMGLLCWLFVLKTIPLSIAFPVLNGIHLLVPVGAQFILHEHVSLTRWLGIGLAMCGVLLILQPVAAAEEKL